MDTCLKCTYIMKVKKLKIILEELHVSLDEIGVVESFNELGNNKLTNIEKNSSKIIF